MSVLFLPSASIPLTTSENEKYWHDESDSDPLARCLTSHKASTPTLFQTVVYSDISGQCRCGDIIAATSQVGFSHVPDVGKERRAYATRTVPPRRKPDPSALVQRQNQSEVGNPKKREPWLAASRYYAFESNKYKGTTSSGAPNKDSTILPVKSVKT